MGVGRVRLGLLTLALALALVGAASLLRGSVSSPPKETSQPSISDDSERLNETPPSYPGYPPAAQQAEAPLNERAAPLKVAKGSPATVQATQSPPSGSAAPLHYACPSARTCPLYKLLDESNGGRFWRPESDGIVRIRYWINPAPPLMQTITAQDIEGAIQSAVRTWESASGGKVDFIFQGLTTREPFAGDGYTDFSFGNSVSWSHVDMEGYTTEVDIKRDSFKAATLYWTPCGGSDGSCTPTGHYSSFEIEDILSHEMGHVMGLSEMLDERGIELTMRQGGDPAQQPSGRNRVTLGLGDILGIRHLYPCDCPLPYIYLP